jgi:hypothetical protein
VTGTSTLKTDNGVVGAGNAKFAINLTNNTNDFVGTVTATGNGISLTDSNALTAILTDIGASTLTALGNVVVSGTVATSLGVTSGGTVKKPTTASVLTVGGLATTSYNASVTVNGAVGALIQ